MAKQNKLHIPRNHSPLFIAGIYVLIASLWIIYSDKIVKTMAGSSPDTLSMLQTYKGSFFVISTGLMLYFLVRSRMKKLQISEARFKTLAENTPDAIACFDLESRYIYGNSVFEKQLRVADQNLFGRPFHEFNINQEIIRLWEEAFNKVLKSKKPVRVEFQFPKKNWFDLVMAPQFSQNNEIISIVSSSRNITEQKKMQQQLQQSQKMQAIGQLAGGIAHDFNNILSVILGYSDMALTRIGPDDLQKEFLENIKKAGIRAKDLVRQILSFSRKKNDNSEPTLLKPIVKEVVGLLRETMPSTIKISSTIEKDTQPVSANSSQVHEIIMNLATNAQHAMDEKGSLTINLYEKLIDKTSPGVLGPLPSGLYSVIEVQDSGTGISNEKIPEIFDPFYTTKEVGKGTGLGLSVVFGLMQSWNGNIKVDSTVGKGTTFKLFFPKTKQINEEKELIRSSSKPTNRNEKILFVDDDETIVKMGEKILLSLGYQVFSTTKSKEALKLLKENINDFDLLISDQTMPEMTGIELAQEVLKDNPEFPILLCTGYSSKLDDATAKELGCKGFVHKPLTISELSEKIQEVLL